MNVAQMYMNDTGVRIHKKVFLLPCPQMLDYHDSVYVEETRNTFMTLKG